MWEQRFLLLVEIWEQNSLGSRSVVSVQIVHSAFTRKMQPDTPAASQGTPIPSPTPSRVQTTTSSTRSPVLSPPLAAPQFNRPTLVKLVARAGLGVLNTWALLLNPATVILPNLLGSTLGSLDMNLIGTSNFCLLSGLCLGTHLWEKLGSPCG